MTLLPGGNVSSGTLYLLYINISHIYNRVNTLLSKIYPWDRPLYIYFKRSPHSLLFIMHKNRYFLLNNRQVSALICIP